MKKIIIIASLSIISTSAMAKTKVYGEMHVSYDKVFSVGADSRSDLHLHDSIFGIKGSNEIKKDVSFIYQLSWGVNSKGFDKIKKSGLENRNQVIGLASPSGALVVGRFDTPFKKVGQKADLFWHSQLGQNRNVTNAKNWDLRADKIIAYQSPRIKGFQGTIAYASDTADTSRITDNASAISLNGFYTKGKYLLGAAYEKQNLKKLAGSKQAIRLSASYRDGPLKLLGFMQQEDNNFKITSEPDALVLGVGASFRKGKGTFKAQWYNRDNDLTSDDTSLFAIGYDYRFSKQLDIYGQAAKITNASNLGAGKFGNTNPIIEDDIHGVSLGIKIKF